MAMNFVETVKKVQLMQHIQRRNRKLSRIENKPEHKHGIQKDIRKDIKGLNYELKVRQESIILMKGRLTNQITGVKETIAKAHHWLKRYGCCLGSKAL